MFALRSGDAPSDDGDLSPQRASVRNPSDWLSVEQAACELGVSDSTVRRRLRQGLLPSRIVPRKGGFAYRVYLPESRHGRVELLRENASAGRRGETSPVDLVAYRRRREQLRAASPDSGKAPRIQGQPERIPEALLRALSLRPRPVPAVVGVSNAPFAQYRELVRRRRWWPF